MPRPRGVTTRLFTNRSRAIVLEAEWMVMTQRIADELKPLVKLASDQGWRIEAATNGTKLRWSGPNGEGPVFTGYRCKGRELMNYRAELVRAGLKLDEKTGAEHYRDTNAVELLDKAEAASVEQIHEAMNLVSASVATLIAKAEVFDQVKQDAEEWERLASETTETMAEMRKQMAANDQMLQAIRDCFALAPWAILPEIAKLLGIESGGPGLQSVTERTIR